MNLLGTDIVKGINPDIRLVTYCILRYGVFTAQDMRRLPNALWAICYRERVLWHQRLPQMSTQLRGDEAGLDRQRSQSLSSQEGSFI